MTYYYQSGRQIGKTAYMKSVGLDDTRLQGYELTHVSVGLTLMEDSWVYKMMDQSVAGRLKDCADDFTVNKHTFSHWSFMLLHRPLHLRMGGSTPIQCRWTWAGKIMRGGDLDQLVRFCMRRREQLPTFPNVLHKYWNVK